MHPINPRHRILLLTLLATTSVLILFALITRPSVDKSVSAIQPAHLAVITRRAQPLESYTQQRRYLGRVEADQSSALGFEMSGLITAIAVEEGSQVSRGDLLARLDTQLLEDRLRSARASLAVAEAEAQLAQLSVQRERETFSRQLTSQQALDSAEASAKSLQARQASIAADLAWIATQIDKSQLRAPYDGTVADRYLDTGSVVSAASPVVKIIANGNAEVKVSVAESALSGLSIGSQHTVLIAGRELPATVIAIAPESHALTRGVTVLLQLEEPLGALLHGSSANLLLDEEIATTVFKLPLGALTESVRGIWAVYVAEPKTDQHGILRLDRRQVEVVHQSGGDAYVRGGLTAGEQVVVAGVQRLVPGQRVHLASQSTTHEQ